MYSRVVDSGPILLLHEEREFGEGEIPISVGKVGRAPHIWQVLIKSSAALSEEVGINHLGDRRSSGKSQPI